MCIKFQAPERIVFYKPLSEQHVPLVSLSALGRAAISMGLPLVRNSRAREAKLIERYLISHERDPKPKSGADTVCLQCITGSHQFGSASCEYDSDSCCRAIPGESPETAPKIAHARLLLAPYIVELPIDERLITYGRELDRSFERDIA